jgi:hypothetical protein
LRSFPCSALGNTPSALMLSLLQSRKQKHLPGFFPSKGFFFLFRVRDGPWLRIAQPHARNSHYLVSALAALGSYVGRDTDTEGRKLWANF